MTDWSDVEAAVEVHSRAYSDMLKSRQENQAGTKKVRAAEDEWLVAHEARYAALVKHWTEADGYAADGDYKRAGPVLQRYYHEMQAVWKARAAEEKAKKKEAKDG
jgi:hypothetical protein